MGHLRVCGQERLCQSGLYCPHNRGHQPTHRAGRIDRQGQGKQRWNIPEARPAYNYGVVRLLNLDEDVSVYEMQGNWYRVIAAGDGGYVHKDALNIAGVRKNASTARNAVSQGYVESSSIGQTIVDEARKHLGIKYVYSQESPAMGFDCSGFAWYVFRQCGIDIQRTAQGIFDNDGTSVGYDQLQAETWYS
jgi:cell wall-associated NlpC family hydrolase